MAQGTETPTPERVAELRAKHIEIWRGRPEDKTCLGCKKPWPCDTAEVLASLDESERRLREARRGLEALADATEGTDPPWLSRAPRRFRC